LTWGRRGKEEPERKNFVEEWKKEISMRWVERGVD